MKYTIYVVTNTVNGKKYVGQTISPLVRRFNYHVAEALHLRRIGNSVTRASGRTRTLGSRPFLLAILKYGRDSFSIEQITSCVTVKEADKLEGEWARKLHAFAPEGYTLRTGSQVRICNSKVWLAKQRAALNQPHVKRAQSLASRKAWNRNRVQLEARLVRMAKSARNRRLHSIDSTMRWKNPEYRSRLSKTISMSMTKWWATQSAAQRKSRGALANPPSKSKSMKKWWESRTPAQRKQQGLLITNGKRMGRFATSSQQYHQSTNHRVRDAFIFQRVSTGETMADSQVARP